MAKKIDSNLTVVGNISGYSFHGDGSYLTGVTKITIDDVDNNISTHNEISTAHGISTFGSTLVDDDDSTMARATLDVYSTTETNNQISNTIPIVDNNTIEIFEGIDPNGENNTGTLDITPSATITTSDFANPQRLIDNDLYNYIDATRGVDFVVDFTTARIVNKYRFHSSLALSSDTPLPTSWIVYGSNDELDWTLLESVSGIIPIIQDWYPYRTFINSTAYRYYKFENIQTYGPTSGALYIGEMEMVEATNTITQYSVKDEGISADKIKGTDASAIRTKLDVPTQSDIMNWESAPSSPSTAISMTGYLIDTTSSTYSLTLPATPLVGDMVGISDFAGNSSTNNITLGRNSTNIDGLDEDLVINIDKSSIVLVYTGATVGWQITYATQVI